MLKDTQDFYKLPLKERIRLARMHVSRPDSEYEAPIILHGDET